MVFKRKAGPKKGRRTLVRKSNLGQLVNKALLRTHLIEQKRHRGTIAGSVQTTPSIISILNGNVQGLGDLNVRTGDEITLSKINMNFSCLLGDSTNLVRVILISWDDNNAVAPVATDIFDDTTSATTMLFGPLNEDNLKGKRFRVLYDKRFALYSSSNYFYKSFTKVFSKGHSVVFSGASSSVGRHMPYCILISDSSAIAHPDFNAYHVSHYTDL